MTSARTRKLYCRLLNMLIRDYASAGDVVYGTNLFLLFAFQVVSRRADRHFEEEGPVLCAALDGACLPNFPDYTVLAAVAIMRE
jgi:hypothetical protein